MDITEKVRAIAKKKILFLPHAVHQMISPDRMIATWEVRQVVLEGKIIEDYPEDVRGHSCLVLGWGGKDRPIHVVCAPKDEYLVVITAYIPDSEQWSADYDRRRRK